MKKLYCFISVFFCLAITYTYSQDTASIVGSIKLKDVSQKTINDARMAFTSTYTKKSADALFSGIVFVGPALGNQMTSKKYKKLGNATFMIPTFNNQNEMNGEKADVGKIIQDKADFDVLWNQIKKDLGTDVHFRDLNRNEIFRCWQLFAETFNQPFFVVENGDKGYIVIMTTSLNILFLDRSIPEK